MKIKGYKLEPGDIIKLGRMEYVVIEAKDKNGKVTAATGDPAKVLNYCYFNRNGLKRL